MSVLRNVMLFNTKMASSLMDISMDISTLFFNYCIPSEYKTARILLVLLFGNLFFMAGILFIAFFCGIALEVIIYYAKNLFN